jgi:hypothetical protein
MTGELARRMSVDGRGIAGGAQGGGRMGGGTVRFAAAMVGIGLCAGLALASCEWLIETAFRTPRW